MQSSEHGVQMQKQRRVSNTFGKEKGAKKKKTKTGDWVFTQAIVKYD